MNIIAITKCVGGYLLTHERKLGTAHVFTSFPELMAKAQEMLDGPEPERPKGQLSLDEINELLESAEGSHGV